MFHTDSGNWAEAAKWEEKFARGGQGNADAYLRTVSLYLQADMPLQAAEVGRSALEHGDSGALHNAPRQSLYDGRGRLEEGLRHLRLAVESQPYEEAFHYDLGFFHLRQQDFAAARTAFLGGRKVFDKSAAIEIGLGIAAYGQREFQQSRQPLPACGRAGTGNGAATTCSSVGCYRMPPSALTNWRSACECSTRSIRAIISARSSMAKCCWSKLGAKKDPESIATVEVLAERINRSQRRVLGISLRARSLA